MMFGTMEKILLSSRTTTTKKEELIALWDRLNSLFHSPVSDVSAAEDDNAFLNYLLSITDDDDDVDHLPTLEEFIADLNTRPGLDAGMTTVARHACVNYIRQDLIDLGELSRFNDVYTDEPDVERALASRIGEPDLDDNANNNLHDDLEDILKNGTWAGNVVLMVLGEILECREICAVIDPTHRQHYFTMRGKLDSERTLYTMFSGNNHYSLLYPSARLRAAASDDALGENTMLLTTACFAA